MLEQAKGNIWADAGMDKHGNHCFTASNPQDLCHIWKSSSENLAMGSVWSRAIPAWRSCRERSPFSFANSLECLFLTLFQLKLVNTKLLYCSSRGESGAAAFPAR